MEKVAGMIIRSTEDLVVAQELEEAYAKGNTAKSILDGAEPIRQLTLERLQIDLAFRFSTDVEGRAQRCLELTEYVLQVRPSEPVLKYLRRLGRCYIDGAYPECAILAREEQPQRHLHTTAVSVEVAAPAFTYADTQRIGRVDVSSSG